MKTVSEDGRNKLVLVDGHAVAFHSWYSSYPQEVIPGFMRKLAHMVRNQNASHLMIAFDPAPPTFRHKMYPPYKGKRPPVPKEFLDECRNLFELLDSYKIPHFTATGFEADDILGMVSKIAIEQDFEVLITTTDLDILQLLERSLTVEVFSQYWPTRTFNEEAAQRHFGGVPPRYLPDLKALMGDRSDNLPGVVGIGEKSATKLLNKYEDLDVIYSHIDEIDEMPFRGAKRVSTLLKEHKDEAFKMRALATIVREIPGLEVTWASITDDLQARLDRWAN